MHRSSFEFGFTHDDIGLMDIAEASGEINHGSWMVQPATARRWNTENAE